MSSVTKTASPPAPTPSQATGGPPVVLLGVAAFAAVATMRAADPLIPEIARDFSASAGDAAIVSSAFTIAYAVGQFIYGPLGDRVGKLTLIAWMTVISGFTVAAASLADTLQALGLLRFIGGMTVAAIVPLSMAFIGDHVPYEKRQPVLARMMSGTIFGLILGQVFGGLIGQHIGWRAAFPMSGLIFLVVGLLLFRERARNTLPPAKRGPAISVTSLIRGYRDLFGRPWARIILLAAFVEGIFFYGSFTFIGADLHERFGLAIGTVGLLLSFFGLGGIIYIVAVRRLVKLLGERGLAMAGGFFLMLSLASLPFSPLVLIPFNQLLLGLGLYMLHNTLQTHATQMAPDARGLAVSTFANVLFVGQAVGITASGLLVDRYGFAPSYLLAAAGLLALALTFAHLLNQRTQPSRP